MNVQDSVVAAQLTLDTRSNHEDTSHHYGKPISYAV